MESTETMAKIISGNDGITFDVISCVYCTVNQRFFFIIVIIDERCENCVGFMNTDILDAALLNRCSYCHSITYMAVF